MRRAVFKLALAAVLLAGTGPALARCIGRMPDGAGTDAVRAAVKWDFDGSDAVFTGAVTAMDYRPAFSADHGIGEAQYVRLAVQTRWKGRKFDEIMLRTSRFRHPDGTMSMEDHDYLFEVGKTYLVYAQRSGEDLSTSACTRTRPIDQAAADVEVLDTLTAR